MVPPFRWIQVCEHLDPLSFGGGYMIIKMCSRCKKPVVYPATYCERCLPVVEAEREAREQEQKRAANRAYNKRRDPKYTQFYKGRQWRMLSARYLQDHAYKCESCGGLACEVHHMEPIQTEAGWIRRYDVSNLKAVCTDCHNAEHDRFRKSKRQSHRGYVNRQ